MVVVVNDTSVLIDLIDMHLLDRYTELGWELRTTDLIIEELSDDDQFEKVKELINKESLFVDSFDSQTMLTLSDMSVNHANLSIEDCSVWYSAKTMGAILMTADKNLRKTAGKDGVEVHGGLYVVQRLLDVGSISADEAIFALQSLKAKNQRAPITEVERLIEKLKN